MGWDYLGFWALCGYANLNGFRSRIIGVVPNWWVPTWPWGWLGLLKEPRVWELNKGSSLEYEINQLFKKRNWPLTSQNLKTTSRQHVKNTATISHLCLVLYIGYSRCVRRCTTIKFWNGRTDFWQDQIPVYTQVFCKVHDKEKIRYHNYFRFWFKNPVCVSAGYISL